MSDLSTRLLLRTFFRTFLVGAAYNKRGLQNVGFMYIMAPGLAAIYGDSREYRQAAGRYVRHYNCHPFWTPLLAGMFLRTETDIAGGRITGAAFMSVKDTATYTLSAIGDSVFGGTALVTWSLGCVLFFALNEPAAAALTALLFCALMLFKAVTFAAGLRFGFSTLFWLRGWDLINWGDRLKIVNALLLLVILALFVPEKEQPVLWAGAIVCTLFAAWLVGRLHMPRTILALAAALGVMFFV